jgi:aminomethyltransferase
MDEGIWMTDADPQLARTPLHELHVELGAKLVPFAGYEMPVQYPMGVLKEHQHTRTAAGLFDVSHMGQIELRGDAVDLALETLVPADIVGLALGRQRYALFTNAEGGILDDLMVTRCEDHLALVVNAGEKQQDLAHLRRGLPAHDVRLRDDRALLALQGPLAGAVMASWFERLDQFVFMQTAAATIAGVEVVVSRSGYTGEDGFEMSMPADAAVSVARALLAHEQVAPIGLGARDSLRLEAGLCLYGHDIDADSSPVEASLTWAIPRVRRRGGARPGGYPGASRIDAQLAGTPARKRVGLAPSGRAPLREGVRLMNSAGDAIGHITSGSFGPAAGAPVAMGYVSTAHAAPGTSLHAELRGRAVVVEVVRLPFVAHRYYRGPCA